jgi:hypothetical protein
MIITHTMNAEGLRRVYLGGKSSLECWVTPLSDGIAWKLHTDVAPGSAPLADTEMRSSVTHLLLSLAHELNVAPLDLNGVPFEMIAALHTTNPLEYRRITVPRRQAVEHGYMATAPNITRPRADYTTEDFDNRRQRQH